ncbi:MAG: hypothetical protein IJI67_10265 [Clostridia bacterium]|nr:hypothetical protein [Clostridia bacterium]
MDRVPSAYSFTSVVLIMRRCIPKICIIIPAVASGMVLAWCMPQKFLLVLLSLMLIVLGIALIIKH